jgi:hypothetical protein
MKPFYALIVVIFSLSLAACGSTAGIVSDEEKAQPTLTPVTSAQEIPPQPPQPAETSGLQLSELTDSQGAVVVMVKPLDLGDQDEHMKFEIALETHSVDLSMDLAALATLTTDTGLEVQASEWDAPRGGHHVSGTLLFPASIGGHSILDGASSLTLVIKDVDAPERAFTWELR